MDSPVAFSVYLLPDDKVKSLSYLSANSRYSHAQEKNWDPLLLQRNHQMYCVQEIHFLHPRMALIIFKFKLMIRL